MSTAPHARVSGSSSDKDEVPGSQEVFCTVYRGRQSWLHHASYMRAGKVLFALRALSRCNIRLEGRSVFDYGFGAGAFFRYCPTNTRLFGVEQDPVVVAEVGEMLRRRGHRAVDLRTISIQAWREHPLLDRTYDVFLCSHVLEHLEDPVAFLRVAGECLEEKGVFLGLVPINERAENPHHIQKVERGTVERWAEAAGLQVDFYEENDPWLFWLEPLFRADSGWRHRGAQAVSVALGVPATFLGWRIWSWLGRCFGWVTASKPVQAAFILRRHSARDKSQE